jgi:hypothetical protein
MTAVPRPLTVLLVYAVLAVALALPLVAQLGSVVANDLGDPLLNTWILWWNSAHVPLTAAWWNAPSFHPIPDVLAFSEHLLGLAPFTAPVIWLTGNAQLAYNVVFLLTFVLSAWGAYFLGWVLTKRHSTAFVVGLLYGFAPYRMAQFAHVQTMASFWMPVALAALHLYLEERRARWLVLFGLATVLQGLTNGHYLLFFPILVALWTLWFLPRGRRMATLGAVAGAYAASMVLLLPVLLQYRAVQMRHGFKRSLEEMAFYSPRVTDLARGMGDLWLWGPWLQHAGPGGDLFPGLTAVLLIAAAVIWARRADPTPIEPPAPLLPRWTRLLLAIVAGFMSLSAIALLIVGPWRVDLLGVRFSAAKVARSVTQALCAWLVVVATGPGARRLAHVRSPLAFYVAATLIMWVFSFGPSPSVGEVEVIAGAPYRWLTLLPGYDSLRVPARFAMLATLCLAAAGGIALAQLRARIGRRGQIALVAIAAVGALAEGWRSVPLKPMPEPSIVRADDAPGAVVELPLGDPWADVVSVYRGIGHRHPVVNGYSGYFPIHYWILRQALSLRDPGVLDALATHGLRHVVVFHDRDGDGRWRSYAASSPGARLVRSSATQTQYEVPAAASVPTTTLVPLPIAGLEASVQAGETRHAVDGSLETRWSSGRPQMSGDQLTVDLGSVRTATALELALGPFQGDFPRRLLIEGSRDGQGWATLWQGPTGGLAVAAAIEDQRRVPVRITFTPFDARYLRITQLGTDPIFYWTVAELVVSGPPQALRTPGR